MRIIVCGGRNYHNRKVVFDALDRLHAEKGVEFVIQGIANGADYLAWQWADERGIPCGSFLAQWDKHGKAAGPIRNQEMIERGAPDGVVAFPGGSGTADMVAKAEKAGLKVWFPCGRPEYDAKGR
jgi:hypothetical protein